MTRDLVLVGSWLRPEERKQVYDAFMLVATTARKAGDHETSEMQRDWLHEQARRFESDAKVLAHPEEYE